MSPFTHADITITGELAPRFTDILTPPALDFIAALHCAFEHRRADLLAERQLTRQRIENGTNPTFLAHTAAIRADRTWTVAPLAPGLEDRRVEITGPVDRKMTINALNSGAKVWLADMEDSSTPSWTNVINGQLNLMDAIDGEIDFHSPEGKYYSLTHTNLNELPTIVVRPRGWHLVEKHIRVAGEPMSGSLFDFGLYFFHNAARLVEKGRGPYFYLPKLENHLEARLWNDVFVLAQDLLGLPQGTIRATVLIETITAAFEMEEILYELKDHSAGLNAGRWDYIFSVIKNFRSRGPRFVLPDRAQVTMTAPFMRSYTEQLVRACHRRGASAIGGMAAFIPNRKDPVANSLALEKVVADKTREVRDGFDGSWVAHPDLVPVAMQVFDQYLGTKGNQINRTREDVTPNDKALLDIAATPGQITETGIRNNIEVSIRYLESWLRGSGAVAIHNLMEDAATAEISRSQIWQWIAQESHTDTGVRITREWVEQLTEEEYSAIERTPADRFADAREIFERSALGEDYPTFLTIAAYTCYLIEPYSRAVTLTR